MTLCPSIIYGDAIPYLPCSWLNYLLNETNEDGGSLYVGSWNLDRQPHKYNINPANNRLIYICINILYICNGLSINCLCII